MKVTILGTAYPYRGGLAAFNDRLSEEFQSCGDSVSIENFSMQYPDILFPGKTQYSTLPPSSTVPMERSVNSVNMFNWIKVGRKICKSAPDLLVIKYWTPFMAPCLGTVARFAKRNGKTKVVAVIDNIIPHEHHFYDSVLSKYFVGAIDRFVVMSAAVGEELKGFTSRKCSFNPHPVYDNYGSMVERAEACKVLELDPSLRYLMFFGFIRDYKGLDLLLDAYAAGRFWERGVKLIVAGEFYGNSDKYFQQAERLGIKDKILWHNDFIADDMVRYWFGAADIVVQPYKTATQSGITQIAYNFEKPMIVTRVGGLAEIVPDGKAGYVVEPDAAALQTAIDDFFTNRKPDSFASGLKEEKKKYSWRAMIETLKGV